MDNDPLVAKIKGIDSK